MEQHVEQLYGSGDVCSKTIAPFVTPNLTPNLAASQEVLAMLRQADAAPPVGAVHPIDAKLVFPIDCTLSDVPISLDAVMIDGLLDEQRLAAMFNGVIAACGHSNPLACYQPAYLDMLEKMATALCRQGKTAAALRLQAMWNMLAHKHALPPLCACSPRPWVGEHEGRRLYGAGPKTPDPDKPMLPAESLKLLQQIASLEQKTLELEAALANSHRQQQAMQERLETLTEKERHKDEFLATLGHELRNPLAPIAISLKLLRLQQDQDSGSTQWLDTIERQTTLMKRLVDDLLDVSRIRLGKMALRRQIVRLNTIVERAVELVTPLIDTLQHTLTISLPAEPILLFGDPERLEQALANLLQNAAKYSGTAGLIQICAERDHHTLTLSVSDNGEGLSLEVQQKAFDLFAQGDATLPQARGGLGVGLALVRQIVDLHGGTIQAYSEGPGRGSQFVIRLPLDLPAC
jgi:signal transduction histidine kinase